MKNDRSGILLTQDMEVATQVVRDASGKIVSGFVVGSCVDQEAYLVLSMRAGDLKEDPIIGPGLTRFIRGKVNTSSVQMLIEQHFNRAGIDYSNYKEKIKLTINNL